MAKTTALAAYRSGQRSVRTKTHRKAKPAVSLAILAGFAPTAIYAYQGLAVNGPYEAVTRLTARFTGYSMTERKFKLNELLEGWGPVLLGMLAHRVANRTGINKSVRKLTMGLLSI